MRPKRACVIGGGAAGFFAAIRCAEADPDCRVTILEKSSECLEKVRISGGGRCNVTHACFDPRDLATHYPRGERALRGPFSVFQPRDTIAWFARRGVQLKTEEDGRMFPVTDSSFTIINCLQRAAELARVAVRVNSVVKRVERTPDGFVVTMQDGSTLDCDLLMLATGGCKSAEAASIAESLGHKIEPPVPSLFTFNIEASWLRALSGIAIEPIELTVPQANLRERRGPVLITHWGLSGPAVLRLSAWGARDLHALNYRFSILINWLAGKTAEDLAGELAKQRRDNPARPIAKTPIPPLPSRLWEALLAQAGISVETRLAELSKPTQHALIQQLTRTELRVSGKSTNKDEFVTCGGVPLNEVNLKTMESRICEGLYFGGELLDVDGITGGFNFQAAWTTGWVAGTAMAQKRKT